MKKMIFGGILCSLFIGACSDEKVPDQAVNENNAVKLNVSAAQATNITPATSGAATTDQNSLKKNRNNKMLPPNVIPGR